MDIFLKGAGKKYYKEWIFRNTDLSFSKGDKAVILGPNGSGKSTLLQVIAGAILPNEGSLRYVDGEKNISSDETYYHIAFAAPYLELIEEFSLQEIVRFHFRFKNSVVSLSEKEIIELIGLPDHAGHVYKYFSSGMKQKVKLALAILSDTSVLLLDEPCSNLDSNGIAWYQKMINDYSKNRTVLIASNHHEEEYLFCESKLNMSNFKS